MAPVGPTARRRRLATWLAKLRAEAGLTQHDAAQHLGCSTGKIYTWEAGRASIKKFELAALLDRYAAPDDVRELLEELRREGAKRSWWSTYRLPDWFKPYVGLETDASTVCNFEPCIVPGLLQTEEYAREVHIAGSHITAAVDLEKRVAARLERQRRLTAEAPLEYRVVVGEEALHRVVGGRWVMAEQMEHIAELAQLPNVIFQIIPFDAGEHPSLTGGFAVLSFAEQADPDVGYMDHPLGGHVIEDHNDVATLRNIFDDVRAAALPAKDSLTLVRTMGKSYKSSQ